MKAARTIATCDISTTTFGYFHNKNGNIRELQKYFVTTNSGLQLFPMEIRIASMSIMGRFVREVTSKVQNPTNHKFFRKMNGLSNTGKKSRLKKGHMLLVSQAKHTILIVLKVIPLYHSIMFLKSI